MEPNSERFEDDARQASSSNGSSAADPADVGPTGPAAARRFRREFEELREFVAFYLASRTDSFKLTLRRIGVAAVLGLLGLCVAATYVATATVVLIQGIAAGLGHLFGDRMWLGSLVTGFLLLGILAAGAAFSVRWLTISSRERTIEKYERRRRQQQSRFGHHVGPGSARTESR